MGWRVISHASEGVRQISKNSCSSRTARNSVDFRREKRGTEDFVDKNAQSTGESTYQGGNVLPGASPRLGHARFLPLETEALYDQRNDRGNLDNTPRAALRMRSFFKGGKSLLRGSTGFHSGDSTIATAQQKNESLVHTPGLAYKETKKYAYRCFGFFESEHTGTISTLLVVAVYEVCITT
jgi:hypothetical protein